MTRTTEQLSNLIAEIDTKTSQGLGWIETRQYLETVKNNLVKVVADEQKSSNDNEELAGQLQQEITNLQIKLNGSLQKLEETQTNSEETEKKKLLLSKPKKSN